MIDIKFRPCCGDCSERDIYTREDKLYGDGRVLLTTIVIGCKHEKVCKEYQDEKM